MLFHKIKEKIRISENIPKKRSSGKISLRNRAEFEDCRHLGAKKVEARANWQELSRKCDQANESYEDGDSS
jgi:hypothetical protein